MNVLDLFSGIGGFSLGLERAGMRTIAFCEIDPFCRKILAERFPGRPIWDDVRTITAEVLGHATSEGLFSAPQARIHCGEEGAGTRNEEPERRSVDLICGGFPCQDISVAGKGAGIEGERSGLWSEFARIIGEIRPRYVIVENVAALLHRGIGRVLGDLAALGYDAEWHCIPACAVGAPHRRDRVWIVANRIGEGLEGQSGHGAGGTGRTQSNGSVGAGSLCGDVADAWRNKTARHRPILGTISQFDWWLAEPDICRVAHGVPFRVDRLRSLGNAIVPQIAEIIGRAIMEGENET